MSGNIEKKNGRLIIIAGPSGVGKDCLRKALKDRFGYSDIVTCCAGRPIRDNEIEGVDHHFLSVEAFNEAIENNEFLEWFPYRETLKGTRMGEVQRAKNEILIWRIDPASAANVKDMLRSKGLKEIANNAITIYLGVPDLQTLFRRQMLREPVPPKETILSRMRGDWADWEKYGDRYDFIVINKDGEFEAMVNQVFEIITRVPQSDAS